jgi:peptide/nickel transport system permease protein
MINYVIRRLGIALLTLVIITFLVYALIRHMPGTPLTLDQANLDPSKQMSEEEIQRLNQQYGLDLPWYEAYFVWLGNVFRGDLGISIARNGRPVTELIAERIPYTLMLSGTSLILTYLLSIPIGLWATVRADTLAERGVSLLLYMLYSLPAFVAALYLQLIFYTELGWLPLYGVVSNNHDQLSTFGKWWDILRHSILPIICFTYGSLAYYARFIRANMQEVIRQDYIRTAKAKGVSPARIVYHHAFRNTLIPLVTMIGLTLPSLLSGAVILEQIFVWPGMGRLFFEAISQRDYSPIMGLVLVFSVLTLLGQLLADLLYAAVDPRVTYN